MEKKVKRKINILRCLSFIIFICIIYFIVVYLINIKTKNIIILGNKYYSDDQIIYKANIEDYPKFLLLKRSTIKKKLMTFPLIEEVNIEKKYGFKLKITIKEKKILYLTRSTSKYKLSDNSIYQDDTKYSVPLLINYVPSDIEKLLVEGLSNIDDSVLNLISEIEYSKNEYDDKRFLLYMSDGNLVYINTTKISSLNKYINIVTKLDNKKGILYLDSGNYFEIKDK